jgi:hypothetical protein
MTETDFEENIIIWNAQTVQDIGGMLELTLMLDVAPERIPLAQFTKFANLMRKINSENGVGVLLRFMHELNGIFKFRIGPWMPYGMKPTQAIRAWRQLTNEIRAKTNMTGKLRFNISHGLVTKHWWWIPIYWCRLRQCYSYTSI